MKVNKTVLAISEFLTIPYEQAETFYNSAKGKNNRVQAALRLAKKQLNIKLREVNTYKIISQYPGVHAALQHITSHHPQRFSKVFQGKNFFAVTNKQAFAIKDGKTLDETSKRKFRVEKLYEVVAQ